MSFSNIRYQYYCNNTISISIYRYWLTLLLSPGARHSFCTTTTKKPYPFVSVVLRGFSWCHLDELFATKWWCYPKGGASCLQKRRNFSQSHTLRYWWLWRTWHLALCTKQPKAENFAIFNVILYPRVKPCELHAHTFLQFDRSNSSKSGSSSRNKFRLFLVLACFSLSLHPAR